MDVRAALRQFRREPRLVLATIATLGVAIGLNVAVFSVVDAVMFRALPFTSPDRIVWLASVRPDNPAAPFTLPEYMDFRAQARTLTGIAALANWSAGLETDGVTERLQGARLSANSFDVLGVSASAGRVLQPSDDEPGAPLVAVISYGAWQRLFGGAAAIVGRPARINGDAYTIVGVLPRHFPLPLRGVDVVVPLSPDRDPNRFVRDSPNFLRLFGRLRDDATSDRAQAELTSICRVLRQQFPKEYAGKDAVRPIPLHDVLVADYRQSMLLLLAAVLVVLGTALANLMSLTLTRANDRRGELAVRVALGASRLDLIRQLAIEAAIVTVAGCCTGWFVASWGGALVGPWLPTAIPRLDEVRLDGQVLTFALAMAAVTELLLTLAPLGAVRRSADADGLRLHSRCAAGDRASHRARQLFVAGQIAVALLLLLTTTILLGSVRQLQRVHPGFDPDGVFQARVAIPPTYRSADAVAQFVDRLTERLSNVPSVQSAGVTSVAPFSGLLRTVPFVVAGMPPKSDRDIPSVNLRVITPGYLAAIGTRLVGGRSFADTDRADTAHVALVSAALARRFLDPNPIGRHVLIHDNSNGPRPVEVVGVVEDVRQAALDTPPAFDVYIPLRQVHPEGVGMLRDNLFWMIRAGADPAALRAPFQAALRAVDPDAAVSNPGPLRTFVDASLGPRRFNLALFAVFSLTAVLLAVSGVYALVSHGVSQRRREIGLRLAIGATARDVRRMILAEAARLVGAGLAVGATAAIGARPLIAWVDRDAALDPRLATLTAVTLVAVALGAAWLPAHRATRIEPTVALNG